MSSWVRKKIDVDKQTCFEMLSANVRNKKYGFQEQKIEKGFKEFQSDVDDQDESQTENKPDAQDHVIEANGTPFAETNQMENELLQSENPSVYESDREFIELNKHLKDGKSGARGVTLGEDSLQNNARFVISNEDNFAEFQKNEKDTNDVMQADFQSFELENKKESSMSNQTNSLFKNQIKDEEEQEKSSTFKNRVSFGNKEESAISSEMTQVQLSFANESFNQNIMVDPDNELFKKTSAINPINESKKSQGNESESMCEMSEIGIDGTKENLLSSQTLGKKSQNISIKENIDRK
jgi:hypothetical protein